MYSLYGVKKFIGRKVLSRLLKKSTKRQIKSCNIFNAKSLGIVCLVNDKDEYKKVLNLIDFLRKEFSIAEVKVLAFFPFKEDPFYLKSKWGFDYFKLKDLNLFGFPNNTGVRNFINEEFDILLDLSKIDVVPLRFILHYSKSSFKVGNYSLSNESYYDMMIDIDINDYNEYILQIVNYLKMLNNPIEKA